MSLLKELAGHPDWIALHKSVDKARPELPAWDSKEDNTEDWKRKSAMQEGFDLCLAFFRRQ